MKPNKIKRIKTKKKKSPIFHFNNNNFIKFYNNKYI